MAEKESIQNRLHLLEKIKQNLLQRKTTMSSDLAKLSQERVSDGQVHDTGDDALAISMERLQSSLQKADINELHLIDDALNRLHTGEYGYCVDCNNPISDRRLETFPYAARCIVCQEAQEQ